jgi:DNA topoisomerase-1
MRTDSVNLSNQVLNETKKLIENTYGTKYYKLRKYKTKSA